MAQLKDLLVNGTTRFNGTVESDQPFKGNLDGNAATASKITAGIAGHIGNNNKGKYYFIGSYTTTETSWQPFNSKIAIYDRANNAVRAEIFMRLRHNGTDNAWSDKSLKVIASTTATNFYLIEISSTEIQLWCQITHTDFWEPRVVTLYGDTLNFTDTPEAIYDSLPEGTIIPAEYDIQQHAAYGTCSTASATAEKAVTVSSKYWDMTAGSIITVKFTNTNTAQNPTLNVNGTGALPIIYNVSAISTTNLMYAGSANRYITYVYTGTAFVFIGWSIDNSTEYDDATTSKSGLMSASDKTKLNGIDVMKGASATNDGSAGLVPAPIAGSQDKFLCADGSWSTPPGKEYSDATESSNGLMSASDKIKLNQTNIAYGTCDTSSADPSKIVSLIGNSKWKPTEGSIIIVKFTNDNTAANPTLNVNDTEARPILYIDTIVRDENIFSAGQSNKYTQYMYNGSEYVWLGRSFMSWRGIQDNLESTSTTQSLSANQGRILKEYIDDLQEAIDNVQENIVTDYTSNINITNSSAVSSLWSTAVKKIGHNVNFVVNITVKAYNGNSIKIGYLPEAARPIASVSVNTVTNAGVPCYIFVDADGGFGLTKITGTTWSANEGVRGCFSFMTPN